MYSSVAQVDKNTVPGTYSLPLATVPPCSNEELFFLEHHGNRNNSSVSGMASIEAMKALLRYSVLMIDLTKSSTKCFQLS